MGIRQTPIFGALSDSTWYFVVAWHDSVNNEVGLQINNTTPDTASYSLGVRAGTNACFIGAQSPSATNPESGRGDQYCFWKTILTADQKTSLYNGGSGLAYSSFTT